MSRFIFRSGILGILVLMRAFGVSATSSAGVSLSVLVDGSGRPEYFARGAVYVEALRGRDYELRLTNPFPMRVAVALSVDGLNSIDARHTDGRAAQKWVIEPYGSLIVPGWQTSGSTARHFVFTGERASYGARLGQVDDLGVIQAIFYREREAPAPVQPMLGSSGPMEKSQAGLSDELAATGMGGRTHHDVENVYLDLEPAPVARIRIRYEYRPELIALGVLPSLPSALDRREHASGFSGSFCPER